jgi:hypothetical protein
VMRRESSTLNDASKGIAVSAPKLHQFVQMSSKKREEPVLKCLRTRSFDEQVRLDVWFSEARGTSPVRLKRRESKMANLSAFLRR